MRSIIVVRGGMTPSAKGGILDMAPKYVMEMFLETGCTLNGKIIGGACPTLGKNIGGACPTPWEEYWGSMSYPLGRILGCMSYPWEEY